jgi:glyoxylase-like metal-dependent hydrolase (beta-lactamase superfamily II)
MNPKHFRTYRADLPEEGWLARVTASVADRPGELAVLAGLFARHGVNIVRFHYNRSEHPHRVLLAATAPAGDALVALRRDLEKGGRLDLPPAAPPALSVLDDRSILNMGVRLEHRPGALADFAGLLRDHDANLIFMSYDEGVSETAAAVSIVTRDPGEVDRLLRDLNAGGYFYTLHYRGVGQKEVDDIIGLNLVERFYFRLRRLLGTGDVERLQRLVDQSTRLTESLVAFSREAGRHLGEGEVLTNVLAFASASLTRTGPAFSWRRLPGIDAGRLRLHVFRLPTGSNLHLLEAGDELVMVDCGYGLYFEDVVRMLRENGFDPARIGDLHLTHTDADHAGMSGRFAREFGTRVHLHPAARGILEHENRAWGSGSELLDLNHFFTVLVNGFTSFEVPTDWVPYGDRVRETIHGFPVVDGFEVGGHPFAVVAAGPGHTPGQVFIVGSDTGLVFTGDYLLRVESLSPEERDTLNLPRFMMTSTNADSRLFRAEMESLRALVGKLDAELRSGGGRALVIPGHGEWYEGALLS